MKKALLIGGGAVVATVIALSGGDSSKIQEIPVDAPIVEQKTVTHEKVKAITDTQKNVPKVETKFETKQEPKVQPEIKTEKTESNCNPNYSGCLKIGAGDYDCKTGTGNGPNYTGMVRVLGQDEFDLDGDKDGVGCEQP